mgnify:CR=1 FL=1
MGAFFNPHSFLIAGGLVVAAWAALLLVRKSHWGWVLWSAVVLLLFTGWLVLRIQDPGPPNTLGEIEAALSTGQPVLVEIYSNY